MASVAVPMHSTNASNTSPMTQWSIYNSDLVTSLSPSSSHSCIGSTSSSTSSSNSDTNTNISNNAIDHIKNNNSHYYFSNCAISYQYQIQRQMMPPVARAIPIVNPTTRQVSRHQRHHQHKQNPDVHPSFYNVSVC